MDEISDRTRRDPSSLLTLGRTIMANDRTLLAFLRTSLAFGAAGVGMIKYLDPPIFDVMGWIFVAFSGVILSAGIHRYRHAKKILKAVTPKDQQAAEEEMGL